MARARTVSYEVAQQVQRLGEETDEWGRKRWSQEMLGQKFGLSASTVGRILNRAGAYRKLVAPKSELEVDIEAQQVTSRLMERIQKGDFSDPGRPGRELLEQMSKKEVKMPSAEALAKAKEENEKRRLEEELKALAAGQDKATLVAQAMAQLGREPTAEEELKGNPLDED